MVKKRKALGNLGVDALLSDPTKTGTTSTDSERSSVILLGVEKIAPNRFQPRINMDDDKLEELSESIRRHGVIEPIVVRTINKKPGQYELIAGERRWRAAQKAGMQHIYAVVRSASDQEASVLAMVENMEREELNTLEQAAALQNLIERFSLTHEEVATVVGYSRANVSNLIRLLDLDDRVQELLNQKSLQMGHARALLRLPKRAQMEAALKIIRSGMTTRKTEKYVETLIHTKRDATQEMSKSTPEIARQERRLSEYLGTEVKIQHQANGRGKLVISYSNLDVFEGIVEKII